jgi:hypothetical protein
MTNGIAQIPGFIAGTWQLDPNHSDVGFVVGHLVMSKVHGRFDAFKRLEPHVCQLGPGSDIEFAEYLDQVVLHGALADE